MTHTPTDERHFAEFDLAHPEVWERFQDIAFALMAECPRYSADGILHVIRFQMRGKIRDKFGWRINNDYSAFYSRKWRERYPEYAGFFQTRASRADRRAFVNAPVPEPPEDARIVDLFAEPEIGA